MKKEKIVKELTIQVRETSNSKDDDMAITNEVIGLILDSYINVCHEDAMSRHGKGRS